MSHTRNTGQGMALFSWSQHPLRISNWRVYLEENLSYRVPGRKKQLLLAPPLHNGLRPLKKNGIVGIGKGISKSAHQRALLPNPWFCQPLWRELYMCACMLNHFATLWTVAHQAPLCMGFSRQEYWSGLPCPSLENHGIWSHHFRQIDGETGNSERLNFVGLQNHYRWWLQPWN